MAGLRASKEAERVGEADELLTQRSGLSARLSYRAAAKLPGRLRTLPERLAGAAQLPVPKLALAALLALGARRLTEPARERDRGRCIGSDTEAAEPPLRAELPIGTPTPDPPLSAELPIIGTPESVGTAESVGVGGHSDTLPGGLPPRPCGTRTLPARLPGRLPCRLPGRMPVGRICMLPPPLSPTGAPKLVARPEPTVRLPPRFMAGPGGTMNPGAGGGNGGGSHA